MVVINKNKFKIFRTSKNTRFFILAVVLTSFQKRNAHTPSHTCFRSVMPTHRHIPVSEA